MLTSVPNHALKRASCGQKETSRSVMNAMLQRLLAVFLYVVGWVIIGLISIAASTAVFGAIPARTPESELTTLQSFARFCLHYWFTAFVFLSPPVCFVIWLLLRRNGTRRTRWRLLGISLLASPLLLIVAWILFRPVLFPPSTRATKPAFEPKLRTEELESAITFRKR